MPAPGAILNLTLQLSLRVVPKVVDSNGRNVLITLRMLRRLFFYDYRAAPFGPFARLAFQY